MSFKEHSIFLLILALFNPCHLFSQSPEQIQPEEMTQLSPSLAEIPIVLDLAKTFSDTTLGLFNSSDAAFEQYSNGHALHESMLMLRKLILRFQDSLSADIQRLNETLSTGQPRNKYLADNLQFSILPPASFQQSISECGLKKGFIPFSAHQLENVIDFQDLPQSIYIAQNPIFVNRDLTAWQTTITENAQKCTIWQPNEITEVPELVRAEDCSNPLETLCLQSVGANTHSYHVAQAQIRQQLFTTTQHLYYLLSQLLFYPSPDSRVASDIGLHLTQAYTSFANYTRGQTSLQAVLAARHCVDLAQLSLHKAQHAEAWKVEERQQSNFEQIQTLVNQQAANIIDLETNQHSKYEQVQASIKTLQLRQQSNFEQIQTLVDQQAVNIKTLESDFQALSAKQSQRDAIKGKGPKNKRAPSEGSGLTDHLAHLQQNNDENDDDNQARGDNNNDEARSNADDDGNNADDDTQARDDGIGDNADGGPNEVNAGNADNGDNGDDTNPNNDVGDDAGENRPTNTTSLATGWSNYFTWDYWYPDQNQSGQANQSNQVDQESGQLERIHPANQPPTQIQQYNRGNDSFPSFVYNHIPMVHLWPFVKLFTLASYHLFAIVDFYINMLWKILTVFLAVYTFILSQRITRLEARCLTCERRYEANNQTQSPAFKDLSNLKTLASRHARHQIQLADHHEPDSAQSLLPRPRRPNDPQTCL